MKDRLVTLIGGGGFLGRYAAQALLARGARVRIAERDPRRAWFLKPLGGLGQTQFVAADVTRPETLARALAGSDAVVNFVGSFGRDMAAVQADGARAAARAAATAGATAYVHISTVGADADSPAAYYRTKAEGEAGVRAEFPNATILRPSLVFGREDKFVNRFAAMVASAPVVPVIAPRTRFQPVYVADVADAVVAALADPRAHGGKTYALGGPDVISMEALIAWLGRQIGRTPATVPVPDALAGTLAMLPGFPMTRDQWRMLHVDNVVPAGAEGLAALGVRATPLETVAPGWLVAYRRHGRFARTDAAA